MFKFLSRLKQQWLKDMFQEAYTDARESGNRYQRKAAAEYALKIADDLEPWTITSMSKNQAVGVLHGLLGQSYMDLMSENLPHFYRLAFEETQKALEYLTEEDGADWSSVMNNLSILYAESLSGNHAENIESAIDAAQKALNVLDREHNRSEWINAMANLGGYYAERQSESRAENLEKSIRIFNELHDVMKASGSEVARARILVSLASSYAERRMFDREGNIEKAIEKLEEALKILTFEANPESWARAHGKLSKIYLQRIRGDRSENFRRAFEANERCAEAFKNRGAHADWAHAMIVRIDLFENCPYGDRASNLQEALKAGEQALTVFTADVYPEDHIYLLRALAHIRKLQFGGAHAETLEDIIAQSEKRLATLSSMSPSDRASTLVQLGNAYAERVNGERSENMKRSIDLLEQALMFTDERTEPRNWGITMNSLAQSYMEWSDGLRADNLEKAMALCEAALVVVSNLSDPDEHSAILETLGECYSKRIRGNRRENLEIALEILDAASHRRDQEHNPEAWLRLEQKYLQAERVLLSLTSSERSADEEPERDVEEYLSELHDSATMVSKKDYPRTWIAAHLFLADTYTRVLPKDAGKDVNSISDGVSANCHKALEIYGEMVLVAEQLGDKEQCALLYERIGLAHTLIHLFTGVQRDAAENVEDKILYDEKKRKHYEAAAKAIEAGLEINTLEKSPRKHLTSTVHLGRLHVSERQWTAAKDTFESAAKAADFLLGDIEMSESEMKQVLGELSHLASHAPFVALMLDKPERAVELAEVGRARLLAKALALESLPLSPDLRNNLNALQAEIGICEQRLVSPQLFDRRTPLEKSIKLRHQVHSLVETLNLTDYFKESAANMLTEVMTDGTVVITPVITEAGGRILISACREGRYETHVVECPKANALRTLLGVSDFQNSEDGWREQFLRALAKGGTEELIYKAGNALSDVFATPLVKELNSIGIEDGTRLNILPQGLLGILPLGLASDTMSGKMLLERYEISLSPSLTSLCHAKKRAAAVPVSLVALSNPDSSNPQRSLKFAEIESDFLRKWFIDDGKHGKYYEGRPISPQDMLSALSGSDIWHFATHGKFEPSAPLKSSLSLGGDDFLSLEMLFGTKGLRAPRLVVLSACDTGLYDLNNFPDEFIGLPSGFLQSGAAGVIATLWSVNDLSTALLMGRFYEGYIEENLAPPMALRTAQLWLRDAAPDELSNALSRWGKSEHISAMMNKLPQGNRTMRGLVLDDAINTEPSKAPFASPFYWGGFVYYGV